MRGLESGLLMVKTCLKTKCFRGMFNPYAPARTIRRTAVVVGSGNLARSLTRSQHRSPSSRPLQHSETKPVPPRDTPASA